MTQLRDYQIVARDHLRNKRRAALFLDMGYEALNKTNNDPANLIVFPSHAIHARHHKLNHPGRPCDCPGIRLEVISNVQ